MSRATATGIGNPPRVLAATVAALAWAALSVQYLVVITGNSAAEALMSEASRQAGSALATLRFFSYFTILGNLLAALVASAALAGPGGAVRDWLHRPGVRGAAALYLLATALVYAVLLAPLWHPQGWERWSDRGLHIAVPALYVLWWLGFTPAPLAWSAALRWLLFPLAYFGWVLLRGAWLGEYPYPFVDVAALGYGSVLLNAAALVGLFLALGLALVAAARWRSTPSRSPPSP